MVMGGEFVSGCDSRAGIVCLCIIVEKCDPGDTINSRNCKWFWILRQVWISVCENRFYHRDNITKRKSRHFTAVWEKGWNESHVWMWVLTKRGCWKVGVGKLLLVTHKTTQVPIEDMDVCTPVSAILSILRNEDYRLSCDGIKPVAKPHRCVRHNRTHDMRRVSLAKQANCIVFNVEQSFYLTDSTHKVHKSILAWAHLIWWSNFSRAECSPQLCVVAGAGLLQGGLQFLLSTGTYSALPLFSLFKPIFWHSMLKCIIGKYENAVQSQHCTVS